MDKIERIKMVKAMEFLARNINDEDVAETWLSLGVAVGDIDYGDLSATDDDLEVLDYYIDDTVFADLMDTFLACMYRAQRSGGLYCDDIVSRPKH